MEESKPFFFLLSIKIALFKLRGTDKAFIPPSVANSCISTVIDPSE
jgi:hypothetical protein